MFTPADGVAFADNDYCLQQKNNLRDVKNHAIPIQRVKDTVRRSLNDAAKDLRVSMASIVNCEAGRRMPAVETVVNVADLHGVSVDYLLGRTDNANPFRRITESIDKDILPFLHDHPVFVNNNRWGLVDAINERIRFLNGSELPFSDATRISALPPIFQSNNIPEDQKLSRDEIRTYIRVWVEPISKDETLRQEMCGWYTVKDRFMKNKFGQRFYKDTYRNKWLAFAK